MPPAQTPKRRRAVTPVLLVTITFIAAACNPVFGEEAGPVRHATLTTKNAATYTYSGDPSQVIAATGEPFPHGNVREFFWNTDDPFYPDQESCMTWDTLAYGQPGGMLQPGLAMRIAPAGEDGTGIRGITVNQNIVYGAAWVIWVNTWDTTREGNVYKGVERFDLSHLVGSMWLDENDQLQITLVGPPWHVCARTTGDQLAFKLWTHEHAEPGWDDPDHVFRTTLPDGWDHAGYSGGYMGHLRENQTATFSGFTTIPSCLVPEMVDTPYCQAHLAGTESES